MADSIRLVDYYYLQVPDRPGEAAKVLAKLKEAGVNLELYMGFPEGEGAQLDFVPSDAAAFRAVCQAQKWSVQGPRTAILLTGEDRLGAALEVLHKLAEARINVTAESAISTGERFGMVIWVRQQDVKKAATALGLQ